MGIVFYFPVNGLVDSTHLFLSRPAGLCLYLFLGLIEYLTCPALNSIRVVGLQPQPVVHGLICLARGIEDVVCVQVTQKMSPDIAYDVPGGLVHVRGGVG